MRDKTAAKAKLSVISRKHLKNVLHQRMYKVSRQHSSRKRLYAGWMKTCKEAIWDTRWSTLLSLPKSNKSVPHPT
jgi:hypothetical protein